MINTNLEKIRYKIRTNLIHKQSQSPLRKIKKKTINKVVAKLTVETIACGLKYHEITMSRDDSKFQVRLRYIEMLNL